MLDPDIRARVEQIIATKSAIMRTRKGRGDNITMRFADLSALLAALDEMRDALGAALAYDAALESCANDPEKIAAFCTVHDDTLDDLYMAWVRRARSVIGAKP